MKAQGWLAPGFLSLLAFVEAAPTQPLPQATKAAPTTAPSNEMMAISNQETIDTTTATFCVIGDVPYSQKQASILKNQLQYEIPPECAFLIHVGDIRHEGSECRLEQYTSVAELMKLSSVPVLMLLGDNDWNDCTNPDEGLQFWEQTFENFDTKHWTHNLKIRRQPDRPFNFAIDHEGALIFGFNIVGGAVLKKEEWDRRLSEQYEWFAELTQEYVAAQTAANRVGRVVIAGHAYPTADHDKFFQPLQKFIGEQLGNQTPILYINGDLHEWSYDQNFFGLPSFLRIMVAGAAVEPVTVINVHNTGQYAPTNKAFSYDRQYPSCPYKNAPGLSGISIYRYLIQPSVQCLELCSLTQRITATPGWTVGLCPPDKPSVDVNSTDLEADWVP